MRRNLGTRALGRVRTTLIRLPDPPRSWLVRRLPTSFVGAEMRAGLARDPEYFDQLYTEAEDPYGFDRNSFEKLKFDRLVDVCGDRRFGRALELGCAVGSFTELLAPRCREVVAVDISAAAVRATSARLSDAPGVRCEVRNLPGDMPSGKFDLIVASDVLYYWTTADIRAAVRWIEGALTPGGVLVAAHYRPSWGVILNGDEAHDVLKETTTLRHDLGERVEFGTGRPYRVDRYAAS